MDFVHCSDTGTVDGEKSREARQAYIMSGRDRRGRVKGRGKKSIKI